MELLDGETGLLPDPGVLSPLVRRARAPRHPEDDQLAEPRVERRLLHEDLVEGQPRLAEREVMGQEAEHLRHRRRVGARQVELRPPEVGGQHGAGLVVPLLDRERATAGSQHRTAVDAQDLAGDVARVVGAEEHAGGGDVVTGAQPAERDGLGHRLVATAGCPSACAWCCIGVSIADGGMLFTVIPWGANSRASVFVRVMTPPFDAAYCAMRGDPRCALDDEMVTIRPHSAATMSGIAAWTQWNVPVRLTSITRFHDSSVISRNGSNADDAGAGDEDLHRAELAAHRADGLVDRRPVGDVDGGTPAPASPGHEALRRRRRRPSPSMSSTATRSPRAASCSQIERPIPEAPPVTTATRPAGCSATLVDAAVLHHEPHVLCRGDVLATGRRGRR